MKLISKKYPTNDLIAKIEYSSDVLNATLTSVSGFCDFFRLGEMASERERSKQTNPNKHIPKDAQVIMSILKELGITDYEPRVINQLLEFTYRYVTCILDDAKVYTNHAKKKVIDLDDVKLASQMVLDKAFTAPPPRDVLLELARGRNIAPLPLIKPHCGLRLPPDRYCLVAANYKLRAAAQNKKMTKSAIENRTTIKTQIKSTPTSAIKRPAASASKAQTVTIPKPVFKFSTTAKTVPAKVRTDVKMEIDDPMMDDGTNKRKREDDD